MHTYPVTLTRLENGQIMAEFPDVPEALTYGENDELALQWAQDALHEALDQYMTMRRDIPTPGPVAKRGVSVAPMVDIKLSIYQAMREKGVTQERLASLLGCDARQVRRLLDIFHNSTLPQLIAALEVLGYRLEARAMPAIATPPDAEALSISIN
jgi:antitoxin HicB